MTTAEAMNILRYGRFWEYIDDDTPEDIKIELCDAIELA